MTAFSRNALATIQFTLRWSDGDTAHQERYLGRRVNAWRDIFPAKVYEALEGKEVGDAVACDLDSGEAVPAHKDDKIIELPSRNFLAREIAGRRIPLREGRFYPQGMLSGLPGVYPQTVTPFRVLGKDNGRFTADLNHPLAGYPLTLEAEIFQLEAKQGDTGGRLMHWMEALCNWGPGMEAGLPKQPVDFFDEAFFERIDETDDALFYSNPRMVGHVDEQACSNLTSVYSEFLEPGMRVLDLMSSVGSHLPEDMYLDVTGLGLNQEELASNPILSRRIVHDLNREPRLPDSAGSFDAVVCSLSIEYLTDPVSVLADAREKLSPGGMLLIGFSNRWFPTKAIQGWLDLHEFERLGLVREIARRAGFTEQSETVSVRNDWRPVDDPHFVETRGVSDPVFVFQVRKES